MVTTVAHRGGDAPEEHDAGRRRRRSRAGARRAPAARTARPILSTPTSTPIVPKPRLPWTSTVYSAATGTNGARMRTWSVMAAVCLPPPNRSASAGALHSRSTRRSTMPTTSTGRRRGEERRGDPVRTVHRAVAADHADEPGARTELRDAAHDGEDRDRDDDRPGALGAERVRDHREEREVGRAVDDRADEVQRAAARDRADVLGARSAPWASVVGARRRADPDAVRTRRCGRGAAATRGCRAARARGGGARRRRAPGRRRARARGAPARSPRRRAAPPRRGSRRASTSAGMAAKCSASKPSGTAVAL